MSPWKVILALLVTLPACSDLGSEPWAGWTEYDLPYAQIYLPPELVRQKSLASLPENPEFTGVVDNHYIVVQFCIYTLPSESSFLEYHEEKITLRGKPAVLFRGRGFLHMYDSHTSSLVGLEAYFRPDGGAVVVVIAIRSEEAYELALQILMSMHPDPRNTGMPG